MSSALCAPASPPAPPVPEASRPYDDPVDIPPSPQLTRAAPQRTSHVPSALLIVEERVTPIDRAEAPRADGACHLTRLGFKTGARFFRSVERCPD